MTQSLKGQILLIGCKKKEFGQKCDTAKTCAQSRYLSRLNTKVGLSNKNMYNFDPNAPIFIPLIAF